MLRMRGKQVHIDNAGRFIEPTVFHSLDNKTRIAQEEIFGPAQSVIPVKDAEQALSVANDTIYGLASAIFTSDVNKAFKFAKGLRAGSVWVNTYDGGDVTTPFGGYKQSGIGRDKSLHASTSSPRSRPPGSSSADPSQPAQQHRATGRSPCLLYTASMWPGSCLMVAREPPCRR